MDKIAEKLKAYIDTHPIDLGDSDCETVLDQLYQAYAESHESAPPEITEGFQELEKFLCDLLWKIIIPCSISVAVFVAPMNIKLSLMVFSMAVI